MHLNQQICMSVRVVSVRFSSNDSLNNKRNSQFSATCLSFASPSLPLLIWFSLVFICGIAYFRMSTAHETVVIFQVECISSCCLCGVRDCETSSAFGIAYFPNIWLRIETASVAPRKIHANEFPITVPSFVQYWWTRVRPNKCRCAIHNSTTNKTQ